jgi:hypothetical protein
MVAASRAVIAATADLVRARARRDAAASALAAAGVPKRRVAAAYRKVLIEAGFTDADLAVCGVSDGNLRLALDRGVSTST